MITPGQLLGYLPEFRGQEKLIADRQTAHDIVGEVLEAHGFFAEDYDMISSFFIGSAPKDLFRFCKHYLPYQVETEGLQTTRSPAGILGMVNVGCDCKHYAGFIGGILDSMNRNGLADYDWCYRFASYDLLDSEPRHVFIVIKDEDSETWVDPVLGSFDSRSPSPFYYIDKKPKQMSLVRISGPNVVASPLVTSHVIRRRADLAQVTGTCGCDSAIGDFNLMTFIQANPIPSLLIAGGLGFLIFKFLK